jgi:VanZ family protein
VNKNIYLLAALIWTSSILVLCLEPFNDLPKVAIKNVDKYVHFTFHFVFVILWSLYFNFKNATKLVKSAKIIVIVSFLFGILIEIAQQVFTTTRKADIFDVCANTTGAIAALMIILVYNFAFKSNIKSQ